MYRKQHDRNKKRSFLANFLQKRCETSQRFIFTITYQK